jgi:hypothetical protein
MHFGLYFTASVYFVVTSSVSNAHKRTVIHHTAIQEVLNDVVQCHECIIKQTLG